MQQPTTNITRVPHEPLQTFVYEAARRVSIPHDQADLLASLLIASDLRGVLSHGSYQIHRYVREIQAGKINPTPNVSTVRETDNSVMLDGDGGLGYFPAYDATRRVIEKATKHGMAAMVTRNHGHIGAAGIYTRLAVAADLLVFATSGVQVRIKPGDDVHRAAGGSPMSFGVPAGDAPPLIVDVGVTHDIQGQSPHRAELIRIAPGTVLRAIAYGTICQTWGGLLTGIPIDPDRANRKHAAANQGAMLYAFRLDLFADPVQFKREVDEYAQQVRQLKPIEGTEGSFLPGHVEVMREAYYRRDGIPLSEEHRQVLESIANELKLDVPWR